MYQTRILGHVLLLLLLVRSTHGLAPIRSLKPQGSNSAATGAAIAGGSHRHASNRKQNKVMTLHQSSATASASINQDNSSSPEQQKNKKSSAIVAATFNLIKACVGSGVLALPAGLALMTDLPKA